MQMIIGQLQRYLRRKTHNDRSLESITSLGKRPEMGGSAIGPSGCFRCWILGLVKLVVCFININIMLDSMRAGMIQLSGQVVEC